MPKVDPITGKQRRGFAVMDADRQREIASNGGKTAHALGKAHEFTSEEAQVAGSIGGKSVSADSDWMAQIGRMGGKKSRGGGRKSSAPASGAARESE